MTHIVQSYNEDAIRALAHQRWIDEGRPDGRHEIHWQWALAQLAATATVPDTTPATLVAPAFAADAKSDVSLIDGIGPKIAKQLAGEGIVSLAAIAALSDKALAALDAKLGLKGRSARDAWIAQARELTAGKAPRAKSDRARAAKA